MAEVVSTKSTSLMGIVTTVAVVAAVAFAAAWAWEKGKQKAAA